MKTLTRALALATLALTTLTTASFAQAQTQAQTDNGRQTTPNTRPTPDAALQRAITRSRFNCLADYSNRQMEAIVYALTAEQLVIISRICAEQGEILQNYVDAQVNDGHQKRLFRYSLRAALAGGRAAYFKSTRPENLRARADYLRRMEQRRLDLARTTSGRSAEQIPTATAINAQERLSEYQEIRRQRRSAN